MVRIIGSIGLTVSDEGTDLTTKGDVHGYSNQNARIPIGNNNLVLMADSGEDLGLAWKASSTSTLTTAGDILVASGANTLSRLARGSDDQYLRMNGTSLGWETVSGGGATLNKLSAETDGAQSVTSTSLNDVTDLSVTITDNTGKFYAGYSINGYMNSTSYNALMCFTDDSTDSNFTQIDASRDTQVSDNYVGDNDGQTLKVRAKVDGGTLTLNSTNVSGRNGHREILEVS